MALSFDEKRLIVADPSQFCLLQWNVDDDGALGDQRIFAETPGSLLHGICLDKGGGVWVSAGVGGVFRVLEGGKVTDKVVLPPTFATDCTLGGRDGRTLLITAFAGPCCAMFNQEPCGHLYSLRVDVPSA